MCQDQEKSFIGLVTSDLLGIDSLGWLRVTAMIRVLNLTDVQASRHTMYRKKHIIIKSIITLSILLIY